MTIYVASIDVQLPDAEVSVEMKVVGWRVIRDRLLFDRLAGLEDAELAANGFNVDRAI